MTLEQLRIFVAVAEREHVTQAARDLRLTQSAVSAAVTALEARYATRLFDRIGRRIELTDAGRLFLVEARTLLAQAAAAEAVLADLAGLRRGSLAIAASQTVANYWLPPLLARFRAAHPGIAVRLALGNTETVAAQVAEARVDIGFVEGAVDDPVLAVTPVAEDELFLVVGPAIAVPARPTAEELTALRWVVREPGSGTRAILEAALAEFALSLGDLDIVLELPSNEAVRAAVEAGAGAAALSRLVVAASLRSGALRALDLALPKRRFFRLRHRERHQTRAETAFYEVIAGAADFR